MQPREFHSIGELEDVSNQLARASKHPVIIDHTRGFEDLDVVKDADGNWIIADAPTETQFVGGTGAIQPDQVAIWNDRANELAYMASPGYALVQHRDVLDTARSVVSNTAGDIEMGVIRDYGSQFDGTLVFSNQEEARIDVESVIDMDGYIPPEGNVDPYGNAQARDTVGLGMRLGNSFDGDKKIYASTMGYRFICQNWMVWGEETIAHAEAVHFTEDDDEDFIEETLTEMFEDVIGQVFEIGEDVGFTIREAEYQEIPLEWVPGMLREHGFGNNYNKRITGRVLRQHTPRDGETTAWRLYNAATSELDHNRVDDIRLGTYNAQQGHASRIMEEEPSAPDMIVPEDELEEFAIFE